MVLYKDVKSKSRPVDIDIQSSTTAVYENDNIRVETINVGHTQIDGKFKEIYQNMYVYDCKKYTREEWIFKMLQELTNIFTDPIIDPDADLDTIISLKSTIMKNHYNNKIRAGIDVELNGVTEHYSLSPQDQFNMDNITYKVVVLSMPKVIFNSDNSLARLYTNTEFLTVSIAAKEFILRETTYCNFMINYIKSLNQEEDRDTLLNISYGDPLPAEMDRQYNEMVDQEISVYRESIYNHLNISIN